MKARLPPLVAMLIAGAGLWAPSGAAAAGLQPIGGFDQPIFVTSDPADPDRLFVAERQGLIKVVDGGSVSNFADLRPLVQCCESERGLLSIALAPDFAETGLLYVDYTGRDGPGNLHVAELRASGSSAPLTSFRNVLTIGHSQAANHNGGQLHFGPDGFLYVSTGDGGSTPANGQNRNSLLGKILRIDPRLSGTQPYSVPQDNPFVGTTGADEVWAFGLRNPWRFSFDRATGDLLIADVGAGTYEELDFAPLSTGLGRGANYGWSVCEGLHLTGSPAPCTLAGRTDPVFEYTHAGGGCSITGGYVARDPTLTGLTGRYLYSDYCLGQIRSLVPTLPGASGDRSEGIAVSQPVSFGEDACGRLYVIAQDVNVFRLTGSTAPLCSVLSVSRRGRGRVVGPGIDCPPDCVQVFPLAQRAVLRAHPSRRANFGRWHLACSGRKRCSLMMSRDREVLASFRGPLRTRVLLGVVDPTSGRGRASLRVKVRPCRGRRDDAVVLFRDGQRVARKELDRRCLARFHPRVRGRSVFFAKVRADARHLAGKSRRLEVKPRG
jgi:hypothetical protein